MNKTSGVVVYRYLIQVQYVFWITEEYRLSEISKVNFCDITMYFSSIVEIRIRCGKRVHEEMKLSGKLDYYCRLNDNICDTKVTPFIRCGAIEINRTHIRKEN